MLGTPSLIMSLSTDVDNARPSGIALVSICVATCGASGSKRRAGREESLSDNFIDEFKRFAAQVVLDMYLRFEQDAIRLMQTFRGIAERVVAISSQDVYRTYGILWRREDTEPNVTPINEDAP